MTEQEIIEYLKENKTRGIAFNFMPKEVQAWCCNRLNYFNDFLQYKNGAWRDEYCFVNPKDIKEIALEDIIILALPENFEPKKENKGEWIEFDINENGMFSISPEYRNFKWYCWQAVLTVCKDLTAFGGWQYEDSKRWYLAPAIKLKDGKMWNSYIIEEYGEATPVMPVKIRFWREYK